jgi:hypothetical protein
MVPGHLLQALMAVAQKDGVVAKCLDPLDEVHCEHCDCCRHTFSVAY